MSADKKDKNAAQEALKQEENMTAAQEETTRDKKEEELDLLKERGAALEEQLSQLNDKLLRVLAEYDNYRKRAAREKDCIYPQAVADTVKLLLPVIDNFERAMQAPCADLEFKKGVEMIYVSFGEFLKQMSVEEIGVQGEEFDPQWHNAVMHTEDESLGKNVVSQVLQKGYRLEDRVIRHAVVQVAN